MAKNKIPTIIQAFVFVTLCMVLSALFGADPTQVLVVVCAIELVQLRILFRRILDHLNDEED